MEQAIDRRGRAPAVQEAGITREPSAASIKLAGVAEFSLFSVDRLGEGYALFANTLMNASQNCNAVLSGEAAMMSKEHFIKTIGMPKITVSAGASGGSYGSSQLADALPGLFDGILISATFPDPLGIAQVRGGRSFACALL